MVRIEIASIREGYSVLDPLLFVLDARPDVAELVNIQNN